MVAPELIVNVAVPLAALAYPLLPPRAAHGVLAGLAFMCSILLIVIYSRWFAGKPFPHVPVWIAPLNHFLADIGYLGLTAPSFRHLQPEDFWWTATRTIGMSLLAWGPCTVVFAPDVILDSSASRGFRIWCSTFCIVSFALSIPTYFQYLTRPVTIVMSRLAARRVRWLFRFWQEDIEANAEPVGHDSLKDASGLEGVDGSQVSDSPRAVMEKSFV
ncbi:hypothetical protein V8C44DRAFT_54612 [Trichoderma aethiopicum]